MQKYQIIGVSISTLVLLLAMIKAEALRKIVANLFSLKGPSEIVVSVSLLIVAVILPAYFGWSLSESASDNPTEPEKPQVEQRDERKSEEAEIIDAAVDGSTKVAAIITEGVQQAQEEKARKQEAFESSKPQEWVYAIGGWISKANDNALEDVYSRITDKTNIYLLKDGSSYRFIRKEEHAKADLEADLSQFEQRAGSSVEIIDLMSYCDFKNPRMTVKGTQKVGKRKQKVFVDYYMASK